MARVCVFGDSITFGFNDFEGGGWAERLRLGLMELEVTQGKDLTLFNQGIPGDRVTDVLRRIGVEGWARRPDRIILAIGLNDTPHNGEPGTPHFEFVEQFSALIETAFELTRSLAIVGLTNVHSELVGWDNEAIAAYNSLVAEAAERHGLTFINPFGLLTDEDLNTDGLHPAGSGHAKLAELIAPHLF